MNNKVLILGAAGNFGSKIATTLAKNGGIHLILAGRHYDSLVSLKQQLHNLNNNTNIDIAHFDINHELLVNLRIIKPFIVVNTCGPFQSSNYAVAEACINLAINYIDLADGREFVCGINQALDNKARAQNVVIISGASSVPCLSTAVLNHFLDQFSQIDSLNYGITPGFKTERGLATTKSILSYTGKLFNLADTHKKTYGWQNIHLQKYPIIGRRWMASCDIPDLDLIPQYFSIKDINFFAGIDNSILHLGLWGLSWMVRLGIPLQLENHAPTLLKISNLFDYFGSDKSGMHMLISGKDHLGNAKLIKWFLIAQNGDGINVPTIPSIILVKRLLSGSFSQKGAIPCIGLISLNEYLSELSEFKIDTYTE